jgi:hypothetical protein
VPGLAGAGIAVLGFLLFLAGVLSAGAAISAFGGTLAVIGMIAVLAGGLIRVCTD